METEESKFAMRKTGGTPKRKKLLVTRTTTASGVKLIKITKCPENEDILTGTTPEEQVVSDGKTTPKDETLKKSIETAKDPENHTVIEESFAKMVINGTNADAKKAFVMEESKDRSLLRDSRKRKKIAREIAISELDTDKEFLLDLQTGLLRAHDAKVKAGKFVSPSKAQVHPGCWEDFPPFDLTPDRLIDIEYLKKSLRIVHEGKFLLCRVISPSFGNPHLHTVVDDPAGTIAVRLSLYDYTHGVTSLLTTDTFYSEMFPIGNILAIKNPRLKESPLEGFAVQCYNPGDIIYVNTFLLKELGNPVWKDQIPEEYRDKAIKFEENECERFRRLGNKYFKSRDYYKALNAFNQGLRMSPLDKNLLDNRCATLLKLDDYNTALTDAQLLLDVDPRLVKAQYRKALALCGLQRYDEAVEFLERCFSEEKPVGTDIIRDEAIKLKKRLTDQLHGIYDMDYFYTKQKTWDRLRAFTDCAEYKSDAIDLFEIEGRGRGWVAIRDLEAGELLMAAKAVALYDPKSDQELGLNWLTTAQARSSVKIWFREQLHQTIVSALATNKDLGKKLCQLYAGPELGHLDPRIPEQCAQLDGVRLYEILRYNENINIFTYNQKFNQKHYQELYSQLFYLPSFFNHSCASNCLTESYREFIFIRSWKKIPEGEEVTISYWDKKLNYNMRKSLIDELNFVCDCEQCEIDRAQPETVHQKREEIISKIQVSLCKPTITEEDEKLLKASMVELEDLGPSGEFHYWLEDICTKLAHYYIMNKKLVEALHICTESYYRFKDSPLISSTLFNLTLIVSIYTTLDYQDAVQVWRKRLNEYSQKHEYIIPFLNDLNRYFFPNS